MAEIKQTNGRPVIDYMARDYDSLLEAMRRQIPFLLEEWTDYESEADMGNVLLQLFAHMGDILSYYQDRIANESFLGTAQTRRSIIHHLRLIGYTLATAAPAAATLKVSASVPADLEEITIFKGDAFATKSQKERPSVRFEYTGETPLVIDCRELPVASDRKQMTADIPVEEGRLIVEEFLGISDGGADQLFPLAHPRPILRALGPADLRNDVILFSAAPGEEDRRQRWTRQENLAFSQNERDFVVEVDEFDRAVVRFGDGTFGRIPESGAEIVATYRVGGGRHGNIPAHTITTIAGAPQLALLGATITNPTPATGGADRESIEHAVRHAPGNFRSQRRAVTAVDYENLALDFKGVGKVKAEGSGWNRVKLHVAPQGGGRPSDLLLANLLAYFEDKRPVATLVEVDEVKEVPIFVTAVIGVETYFDPQTVQQQARESGGAVLAFDKNDFGQQIYLSKFYEALEAVPGTAYVQITEFRPDDAFPVAVAEDGLIGLLPYQLPRTPVEPPYADSIQVQVVQE